MAFGHGFLFDSVHPETGIFVQGQGLLKILPQAYSWYSEDKILSTPQRVGEKTVSGWTLPIDTMAMIQSLSGVTTAGAEFFEHQNTVSRGTHTKQRETINFTHTKQQGTKNEP